MSTQLKLFELSSDATKTQKLIWSYSRTNTLEKCPRKYYYHFYGSNSRKAKSESDKSVLKILKNLSNRYMRTGNILHLVIKTYIKKQLEGYSWDVDQLLRWANSIYLKDREFSQIYKNSPSRYNSNLKSVPLLEYYYEYENVEDLFIKSQSQMLTALNNFVKYNHFVDLINSLSGAYVDIERRIRPIFDKFITEGRIDLIYRKEKGIEIYDWKIGDSSNPEDSLQLLFYACWTVDEFRCQPEDITVHKANLLNKSVSSYTFSLKSLQRTVARIKQDIERMKSIDKYGNNAIVDAFSPCRQPKVCALCPYQEVCFKRG